MVEISEQSKEDIEKKSRLIGIISVGVTWVDGRVVFKPTVKWSQVYYGVCHFSKRVAFLTPLDWQRATAISTIMVSIDSNYCEKSLVCLNFQCPLNRFDKKFFAKEFDCGTFSLGLPQNIGTKPLWFTQGKYAEIFSNLILAPNGGVLQYSEEKYKEYLKNKNLEEV